MLRGTVTDKNISKHKQLFNFFDWYYSYISRDILQTLVCCHNIVNSVFLTMNSFKLASGMYLLSRYLPKATVVQSHVLANEKLVKATKQNAAYQIKRRWVPNFRPPAYPLPRQPDWIHSSMQRDD